MNSIFAFFKNQIPQYQPLTQEVEYHHIPYQAQEHHPSPQEYVQESQEYIQDSQNAYEEYVQADPYQDPYQDPEVPPNPDSEFLLKKAFRKVTSLLDSLFYRG